MQRRFVVEGGVGQPLLTSNGYPEGDPLSVCAMFLVNLALHAFSFSQHPEVCLWTFVDDWQITGTSPEDVVAGMQVVRIFTEMLDLNLDDQKSFFWGTNSMFRQHFRALSKTVKLHLRNLGGHVSYSRLPTNHTVTSRISQGTMFWHWMRRCLAPIDQKIRLLPVVAWPRFLHGSAGVPIGDEHFRKLRSKAMQCLNFDKKGANPLLQFGGVFHPRNDPAFHVLALTIRSFRRFCVPDVAFPILNALAHSHKQLRGPGPCEVFLARLHSIGWEWVEDGILYDHMGHHIHVLNSPIQDLRQRLSNAWEFRVGSTVSCREGFQGLENMSFNLTWDKTAWDPESLGLLRVAMNGTFFTRNKQYATGKVPTPDCPYCLASEDSIMHRYYSCPNFQSIRITRPSAFFGMLEDLPECSLQHGWFCYPDSFVAFRNALDALPDLTSSFCGSGLLPHDGPLHLFTDGGCSYPSNPLIRVASWGFCAADLGTETFIPIAQGPVWGFVQTVLRGELIACISAYQFALARNQSFWIWTDSQLVWDFLDGLSSSATPSTPIVTDHDLKTRLSILHQAATRRDLLVKVIKVRSHMNASLFSDAVERWAFAGNDQADSCEARGLDMLPRDFHTTWQTLIDDLNSISFLRDNLQSLFVQIGKAAVQCKDTIRVQDALQWEKDLQDTNPPDDPSEISCCNMPSQFDFGPLLRVGYRTLGPLAPVVYQWLFELVSPDEGVIHWVNTYQLLILFQQQTGHIGLRRDSKGRLYHEISQWEASQEYEFLQVATDFGIFLRAMLKRVGTVFQFKKRRPSGTSFRGWTNCVQIYIRTECISNVDRFLVCNQLAPIQDVKLALANVPLAIRNNP